MDFSVHNTLFMLTNHRVKRMFHHLLPPGYKDIVKQWVIDDCPTFDVGTKIITAYHKNMELQYHVTYRRLRCWRKNWNCASVLQIISCFSGSTICGCDIWTTGFTMHLEFRRGKLYWCCSRWRSQSASRCGKSNWWLAHISFSLATIFKLYFLTLVMY